MHRLLLTVCSRYSESALEVETLRNEACLMQHLGRLCSIQAVDPASSVRTYEPRALTKFNVQGDTPCRPRYHARDQSSEVATCLGDVGGRLSFSLVTSFETMRHQSLDGHHSKLKEHFRGHHSFQSLAAPLNFGTSLPRTVLAPSLLPSSTIRPRSKKNNITVHTVIARQPSGSRSTLI
jgi:hypothetical protein